MKNLRNSFIIKNWLFFVCLGLGLYLASIEKDITFFGVIFLGLIGGLCVYLIVLFYIGAIKEVKRRADNGIDMNASLESDPEKVKAHMLYIMQHGHHEGIKGALSEFNDIFRNYPQWELENWEVFHAWYKDLIDHAVAHPEIYNLTMKSDGSPYNKAVDPLYDPDAPDWEQYDLPYEEYDDDDLDCDYDDNRNRHRGLFNSFGEAFGFGLGCGLFGVSFGPGSSSGG